MKAKNFDEVFIDANLYQNMPEAEYRKRLKNAKEELYKLGFSLASQKRSALLVFEGWDAAGKGGSIRRLTQAFDPRLYEVHSIAAPIPEEKSRHYLWRFWNRVPKLGFISIFDRSHYGRVLVERVEGFATLDEWTRAYEEINLWEDQLIRSGIIILKFWLQITPEEQKKRFLDREKDPLRRWKLTEEDWRNREKWNLYETAALEMFRKTDTPKAPWILVPANDKYTARVTVLEETLRHLEAELFHS